MSHPAGRKAKKAQDERNKIPFARSCVNPDVLTGQSKPYLEDVGNLAFFDRLLAEVSRRHAIDPKRIYLTGISNGVVSTGISTFEPRIKQRHYYLGNQFHVLPKECHARYLSAPD